jgi:hypothetical protein
MGIKYAVASGNKSFIRPTGYSFPTGLSIAVAEQSISSTGDLLIKDPRPSGLLIFPISKDYIKTIEVEYKQKNEKNENVLERLKEITSATLKI